jgi:hypothetical protein
MWIHGKQLQSLVNVILGLQVEEVKERCDGFLYR